MLLLTCVVRQSSHMSCQQSTEYMDSGNVQKKDIMCNFKTLGNTFYMISLLSEEKKKVSRRGLATCPWVPPMDSWERLEPSHDPVVGYRTVWESMHGCFPVFQNKEETSKWWLHKLCQIQFIFFRESKEDII